MDCPIECSCTCHARSLPLLAFDIDGTLIDGVDASNPLSVARDAQPHARAIEHVWKYRRQGHPIAYVTAREERYRGITTWTLYEQARLPLGQICMIQKWRGYEHMPRQKQDVLANLGAVVYVGDMPQDQEAAFLARVPFVHANDFRNGAPLPLAR